MTNRVLVTGGAGFIGSHLCEHLVERGDEVWALDNFDDFYSPAQKRRNLSSIASAPDLHVVEGDVRDSVLLGGLFTDVGIDEVVHLAARPGVRASIDDPERCYEINVRGTVRLLESMQRHDVRRLMLSSSSSVYGRGGTPPFSEDEAADRPLAPYAASKRASELVSHAYHGLYGFSVHCLRLSTVYGPRQRPDLALHRFARLMESGAPVPVYGEESVLRDYTFVGDAVRAMILSVERLRSTDGSDYQIINVGRSEPIRLDELIGKLGTAMGIEPTIDHRPGRPGDAAAVYASTEKARDFLGFSPEVGLETGLERFVDWYRSESALADSGRSENGAAGDPADVKEVASKRANR